MKYDKSSGNFNKLEILMILKRVNYSFVMFGMIEISWISFKIVLGMIVMNRNFHFSVI